MPEPDWYTKTNKARLVARQDLADALDGFAAALSGTAGETPGDHRELAGLHADTSRKLTQVLNGGVGLPPIAAAGVAELLGYGNEAVTGGLQTALAWSDLLKDKAITHSTVGPAGWDPADVEENRIGQMQALNAGDKRPDWLRRLASVQGAVARFAPGLAPLGALENAATDSPRAAEMVFRSSDQLKRLGQALGLGGGR